MVLEMGNFLTTISNKPMKTIENVECPIFVLFEQNENLIKNVLIYSFFELGKTGQKRYLTWNRQNLAKTLLDLKHNPACLQTTTLIFLKENNLWCTFSASNIGHKLKQSRPPGSITLFLSKIGMVYFTSRLGWFLPVLGPDCQRWCWIETKLLPATHRKKHTHTHTNWYKILVSTFFFHLALRAFKGSTDGEREGSGGGRGRGGGGGVVKMSTPSASSLLIRR